MVTMETAKWIRELWGEKRKVIKVAVAGAFDPLHLGHLRHIQEARKLGDYLIVLVSNDQDMVAKKGYLFMPLDQRVEILKELRSVDEVIVTIDEDGTQAKTLKMVKPHIFAKGGDRSPNSMPLNEIEVCKEIGCKIVYGIGTVLNSSSNMVEQLMSSEEIVAKAVKEKKRANNV